MIAVKTRKFVHVNHSTRPIKSGVFHLDVHIDGHGRIDIVPLNTEISAINIDKTAFLSVHFDAWARYVNQ